MILNLNIIELITPITSLNNTLYKIFFIVPLNYLQFHHVWNIFDKDYSFHKFFKSSTISGTI
jgi:hypothetical protein